ncbi:S8 family serine peptidase [Lysobacter arenosi]|uniref:S8 family serine peptidase n=1 Tax=Lysobacter arenosi TaxID=2795387 RepID=A0ABX7RAI4_9GAMM|nr:S8 family peptidase [Lysobacter arenosi]QSX74503.1 S8 family serine peptidase [Lysobacter arenosi]
MNKRKQILGASALAAAVMAAMSALAASYDAKGTLAPAARTTESTGAAGAAIAATGSIRTLGGSLSTASEQGQFDRFIVRYKDDAVASRSQAAVLGAFNASAQRAGVAGVRVGANGVATAMTAKYVRKMSVGADVIQLSRALDAVEANVLLEQLRADPAVAYAEPDLLMQEYADFVPDDTHYGTLQWHYYNTSGATLPTSAGGINLPKAWGSNIATNGAGVVVGVLDTGYVDHADLNANIVPGYDFISAYTATPTPNNPDMAGDGDGRDADAHDAGSWVTAGQCGSGSAPSNSSWHGTHVAGTIAAVTNNGVGVAGVAYNAKVMPVRVLGHCGGLTSDIADAVTWASGGSVPGIPDNANPVEVINMSLGGSGTCAASSAMQLAVNGAVSRGVSVIVAAGNNGSNAASFSPASCAGVITVGATGVDGSKAFYSNYGLNVALSAPGGGAIASSDALDASNVIWSTLNSGTTTPVASPAGDLYAGYVGTSMAAPHVAGVVALMQSAAVAAGRPALTPALVRQVLLRTARAFPTQVLPPTNTPIGVGIVDANAAVTMAKSAVTPDPAITLANRTARQITSTSKNPIYNTTAGSSNLFVLNSVPAGKASLNIRTYGGVNSPAAGVTSDVALYVKRGAAPTTTDFDFSSVRAGTAESVMITEPDAGNYYVLVVNTKASTDEYVLAAY